MDAEDQEEFNKLVLKCDEPGFDCWLWIGTKSSNGYGVFNKKGEWEYVHRLALEMKLGRPIGPGLQAGHARTPGGHEPACCNPDHLREVTRSENALDCVADGRRHRVNLTDDQVRAIRADPRRQTVIAEEYGIIQGMVSHIKRRIRYASVV
jgi:hypothetical protein